jgi:hypothetical protein
MAKRKPFSPKVHDAVLLEWQRRCALCFFYSTDTRAKKRGQIAHIDNQADVRAENAAYRVTHSPVWTATSPARLFIPTG